MQYLILSVKVQWAVTQMAGTLLQQHAQTSNGMAASQQQAFCWEEASSHCI